jgi:hypothetical protein
MKNMFIKALALVLLVMPLTGHTSEPKPGSKVNGGVFLYRQSMEIYWTDWIAFPIMTETVPVSGQLELTLVADGKKSFIGIISINCENGKYFWQIAKDGLSVLTNDRQIAEIVPRPAISNAIKFLCRRG